MRNTGLPAFVTSGIDVRMVTATQGDDSHYGCESFTNDQSDFDFDSILYCGVVTTGMGSLR